MTWLSVVRPVRLGVALGLVVVGLIASSAAGAPLASCHGPSSQPPNVGARNNALNAVAATSACNAWAVGHYVDSSGGTRTLVEHSNGKAWKVQASPNPGPELSELYGVAATSTNNAWAVGHYYNGTVYRTLIEHWNGKAWKVQASPNRGSVPILLGVAATSAKNAWAVGSYGTRKPGGKTLVEHWNGKAWKIQPSPNRKGVGTFGANGLWSVAATSATNAWAVGSNHENEIPLVEHWNGKAWKIQPSPNPKDGGLLSSVAATSATNAWAVGNTGGLDVGTTLVEHWNGKAWKIQPSPNPKSCDLPEGGSCLLHSVAATSGRNAWAVGSTFMKNLVEHWNGKTWKVKPSPSPGSSPGYGNSGNGLFGVAATSATNAWAVGVYYNGHAYRTLALRWNGTSWNGGP